MDEIVCDKWLTPPKEVLVKRFVIYAGMFVFVAALVGCGGGADGAVKDYIKAVDNLSESIEKKESADKIKEKGNAVATAIKKINDLKLSEEDSKKLAEKHKDALKGSFERYAKAVMANPESMAALQGIEMSSFGKK
jgi:hypothetical protein